MTAPVTYYPDFVAIQRDVFDVLWRDLPWERRSDAPRRECWMNDHRTPYTYGRGAGERTYKAVPWEPLPLVFRDRMKHEFGVYFEGCFVNGYEGPRDHLGWHADDSPVIDAARPIAIISVGSAREIWFRPIGSRKPEDIEKVTLAPGSLLLMGAGMQQTHEHRIPKHSADCGERVSLTYRGLVAK